MGDKPPPALASTAFLDGRAFNLRSAVLAPSGKQSPTHVVQVSTPGQKLSAVRLCHRRPPAVKDTAQLLKAKMGQGATSFLRFFDCCPCEKEMQAMRQTWPQTRGKEKACLAPTMARSPTRKTLRHFPVNSHRSSGASAATNDAGSWPPKRHPLSLALHGLYSTTQATVQVHISSTANADGG